MPSGFVSNRYIEVKFDVNSLVLLALLRNISHLAAKQVTSLKLITFRALSGLLLIFICFLDRFYGSLFLVFIALKIQFGSNLNYPLS